MAHIIIVQILLHHYFTWLKIFMTEHMYLHIDEEMAGLTLSGKLFKKNLQIIKPQSTAREIWRYPHELCVKVPCGFNFVDLIDLLKSDAHIHSAEL